MVVGSAVVIVVNTRVTGLSFISNDSLRSGDANPLLELPVSAHLVAL